MKYTYIDGDNIGLKIEQSFFNNDEEKLKSINLKVQKTVSKISAYLESKEQIIIFAGADGIISKGKNIDIDKLIREIRNYDKDLTFSAGIGSSLKNSYLALRYAKSYGKNIAVDFSDNTNFKIFGE